MTFLVFLSRNVSAKSGLTTEKKNLNILQETTSFEIFFWEKLLPTKNGETAETATFSWQPRFHVVGKKGLIYVGPVWYGCRKVAQFDIEIFSNGIFLFTKNIFIRYIILFAKNIFIR